MNTDSLFTKAQKIKLPDAELTYYPYAFSERCCEQIFQRLQHTIQWTERNISLFGRHIPMPRLTAWYADPGIQYRYSGGCSKRNNWTTELLKIKHTIESLIDMSFNSALLNLYRDGQDSMSWHSDDEKSLGENPVIASVSFGAIRTFKMRHRANKQNQTLSLPLQNGSLLVMHGTTQHFWQHQIAKTRKVTEARINITFRTIQNQTNQQHTSLKINDKAPS